MIVSFVLMIHKLRDQSQWSKKHYTNLSHTVERLCGHSALSSDFKVTDFVLKVEWNSSK